MESIEILAYIIACFGIWGAIVCIVMGCRWVYDRYIQIRTLLRRGKRFEFLAFEKSEAEHKMRSFKQKVSWLKGDVKEKDATITALKARVAQLEAELAEEKDRGQAGKIPNLGDVPNEIGSDTRKKDAHGWRNSKTSSGWK